MDNTHKANWIPFAKPIKYQTPTNLTEEGWILAWRPYYQEQPKAFEPLSIEGIEYLDHSGDIIHWDEVGFIG
jgi:hypothetical protein